MKIAKKILFSLSCLIIIFLPLRTESVRNFETDSVKKASQLGDILDKRANYFSSESRISNRNHDRLIKVLIVPGHDDEYHGTEYKDIREVDLNREIASRLNLLLWKEDGINVVMASDRTGYNDIFERYFENEKSKIERFINSSKNEFEEKIKNGDINFEEKNFHNAAPPEVAYRLYGINRWANVRNFDFVIHIHFNDYRGRHKDRTPKYNGFSIYIPEEQFINHDLSEHLALNIFNRLKNVSPVSNLPAEEGGVIEDNELIAVGSNATLEPGSILIEYGYIYEDRFNNPSIKDVVLDELAYQTYLGIKDMLGESVEEKSNFVYQENLWYSPYTKNKATFELQKRLSKLGYYPTKDNDLRGCPVDGSFGACTKKALSNFQKDYKLPPTGYLGSLTREVINNL